MWRPTVCQARPLVARCQSRGGVNNAPGEAVSPLGKISSPKFRGHVAQRANGNGQSFRRLRRNVGDALGKAPSGHIEAVKFILQFVNAHVRQRRPPALVCLSGQGQESLQFITAASRPLIFGRGSAEGTPTEPLSGRIAAPVPLVSLAPIRLR